MSWVDGVFAIVLVAGGIRGFFRSFWLEILGILEFCGAVTAAWLIAPILRRFLGEWFAIAEGLAAGLAFGVVFLVIGSCLYFLVRLLGSLPVGRWARICGLLLGSIKAFVGGCLLLGLLELFGRSAGLEVGGAVASGLRSAGGFGLDLLRESGHR